MRHAARGLRRSFFTHARMVNFVVAILAEDWHSVPVNPSASHPWQEGYEWTPHVITARPAQLQSEEF